MYYTAEKNFQTHLIKNIVVDVLFGEIAQVNIMP